MEQPIVEAAQASRNRPQGLVILLVLLVTFPLLALLVREQSRVIENQRLLIQQLSIDSQQLNSLRMRELHNRAKPAAPTAKVPPTDTQKPQPSAPAERKSPKRHQSKQNPTPGPQEYPGTRPLPVRKSA